MRDQPLTVADIVEILHASDRDACLRDVAQAVARLKDPETRMLKERQLRNVTDKLDAALKAIDDLPPDWRFKAFQRDVERISRSFASLANHQTHDREDRGRSAEYLHKLNAAHEAFMLMARAPAPTNDIFHNVTGVLFEIATGTPAGDVDTVCAQVITEMRKHGYDPAKPLRVTIGATVPTNS